MKIMYPWMVEWTQKSVEFRLGKKGLTVKNADNESVFCVLFECNFWELFIRQN